MSDSLSLNERPAGVITALLTCSVSLLIALTALFISTSHIGATSIVFSLIPWLIICHLVWTGCANHQHPVFGSANKVTLLRAAVTVMLAGLVPAAAELSSPAWLWAFASVATITLCLDGLDGYLARKSGLSSQFGARFDMETDALLALVITLFIWQSGKLGIWVLALGLMRYLFIAASIWLKPLQANLFPSMRRKTVCVIQVGALCLMLCPWLSPGPAGIIGVLALACLSYSFAVDIHWLFQQHPESGSGFKKQKNQTGQTANR